MNGESDYTPSRVWNWNGIDDGNASAINRPLDGPARKRALPVGEHAFRLYFLATPKGARVALLVEGLVDLRHNSNLERFH